MPHWITHNGTCTAFLVWLVVIAALVAVLALVDKYVNQE
jgi:hypothetical protein